MAPCMGDLSLYWYNIPVPKPGYHTGYFSDPVLSFDCTDAGFDYLSGFDSLLWIQLPLKILFLRY